MQPGYTGQSGQRVDTPERSHFVLKNSSDYTYAGQKRISFDSQESPQKQLPDLSESV